MGHLVCSICHKVFTSPKSLATHIRFHNPDYKKSVIERLNTKEVIERRKERAFGNRGSESYKRWYSKVHNPKAYQKRAETMKRKYREDIKFKEHVGFQKGEKNPMKNPVVRAKVSYILKQQYKNGRKHPNLGKKLTWMTGDKNPSAKPEVRKKISEKLHALVEAGDSRIMKGLQSGWNNHPASKPKYPDSRGNLLRSRGELNVAKVLQELNLDYIYEPKICGYFPDFQLIMGKNLSNKLIEFDGGMRSEEDMKEKITSYLNNGYDVLVLKKSSRISIKESLERWLSEEKNNDISNAVLNCHFGVVSNA